MANNPFTQDVIHFDEPTHKYTVKKTGKELISVSTLIHKYSQPFDPTGSILRSCAIKEGISPEELRQRWDKKRDDSCVRGTSFHEQAEAFIKTGKIVDGPDRDIIEHFSTIAHFEGEVYSEVLVYSIEDGVCGTTDLIEYFPKDNSIIIRDFKTNEKIKKWGFKGQKMLPPLSHLQDANLFHYEMQLSTYAYLLDNQGYWVDDSKMCLYWINPKSRKIEVIPLTYRRKDVINMLDDFKRNNK